MRRIAASVPLAEAVHLVVRHARCQPDRLFKMSEFAYVVWPDAKFLNTQGAARAVSKIVRAAIDAGHLEWRSEGGDWGYAATNV